MSVFDVESAAANLAEWMYRLPVPVRSGGTIGCYLPIGSEPGSDAMLDALIDQVSGRLCRWFPTVIRSRCTGRCTPRCGSGGPAVGLVEPDSEILGPKHWHRRPSCSSPHSRCRATDLGSDAAPAITTAASAHRVPYGSGSSTTTRSSTNSPRRSDRCPDGLGVDPEAGFRQFRP